MATCFCILEPVNQIDKFFPGSDSKNSSNIFLLFTFTLLVTNSKYANVYFITVKRNWAVFKPAKSLLLFSVESIIYKSFTIFLFFAKGFIFSSILPRQKMGKLKSRSHLQDSSANQKYSPSLVFMYWQHFS